MYRTFIIGGSGSGERNALLNLLKQQDDEGYSIIDKIYSYFKDPHEAKYQYFIKKRENNGLKNLKAFLQYSNNMQDFHKILRSITQAKNVMY